MSADETSDPERPPRRRGRLVVGIVGWAILAACVVPLEILLVSFVVSYVAAPGVLGPPTVVDPAAVAAATAVVSGVVIGVGTLGLALVTATRTGPAVGRLARPRRTLRTYLLDLGAASLVSFAVALIIRGSTRELDLVYVDVRAWLASALFGTIAFVVVPVAAVAGIVWSVEQARRRPLPRPVLVVVVAGSLIGWLGLQLLLGSQDPVPWSTAALAAVQIGAFVYSRSAAAVLIPELAIGPALASLPALGTDAGFAAGTLVLGLAMALATRVRVRVVDLGREP